MKQVVLIIDDEESVWLVWSRQLDELKFELRWARSVKEGLDQNKTLPPPDIIFLDLNLIGKDRKDGTSAEETLTYIPAFKAQNPAVRIIIATGWATSEIERMAMLLGSDMIMDKHDLRTQKSLWQAMKSVMEIGGTSRERTESQIALVERISAMLVSKATQKLAL